MNLSGIATLRYVFGDYCIQPGMRFRYFVITGLNQVLRFDIWFHWPMLRATVKSRSLLGILESLIMASVLRKGEISYAKEIWMEIEARSKHKIPIGAVHTTLDRLGKKDYVNWHWDVESTGHPKKLYKVTDAGRLAHPSVPISMRQNPRP